MDKPKRGRPRKQEDEFRVWKHYYYSLSEENNKSGLKRTAKDRLLKGYTAIFTLSHNREPSAKEIKEINQMVTDIIDRV